MCEPNALLQTSSGHRNILDSIKTPLFLTNRTGPKEPYTFILLLRAFLTYFILTETSKTTFKKSKFTVHKSKNVLKVLQSWLGAIVNSFSFFETYHQFFNIENFKSLKLS
jgi:hypothetical protein